MARSWQKFLLLMWKNWTIQKRQILQTVIEILAPVLFCCLLGLIRSLIKVENHKQPTTFEPFDINGTIIVANNIFPEIAYSPANPLINTTMERIIPKISFPPITLRGFETSEKLEQYLNIENTMLKTLCGVQFHDALFYADVFPDDIIIALRFPAQHRSITVFQVAANWMTNMLFTFYQVPGPRSEDITEGGVPPGYYQEHFITIQHFVSLSIIEQIQATINNTSKSLEPHIMLQRFPYPSYIGDPLLQGLASFMSLVIMLSFVYTAINTVKVITNEKEKQVKEVMKIMGLPNWLHWTAWFIKSFMFLLVSVILIVILMKVPWLPGEDVSVFTNSDATVIFVFLCLYICTTITFCFAMSSFFSKAYTAATITGLFWFLSYSPYLFLHSKYGTLSLGTKIAMCLGSNSAMAFGFQFMLMFEGTSKGLQWDIIWEPINPNDTFMLGHVMIMLIVDALIYLLITLYIEAIFPGDYGLPKPWYFPLTKSFWCGKKLAFSNTEDSTAHADDADLVEKEPNHLHPGIQIKALRKIFKNKKVAVRGLNLNMYEDQITALLGHNGAGKTTTMSMLTGIYPPTSGTALVAGHDIRSDMSKIRASLGLCPQHNVLFDDLTVKEHLYFFGKLKGLNKHEIERETLKYIELLELVPKTNAKAGTLSGGMKRKLSVGIALCGNSKIVMLDEPTAGMDPAARRAVWDILQSEKQGRTILLTTHFMDEADLLGDRIAIMAGGMLQCCGSSFFLKKKYGAGYHLTLEKSSHCKVSKITDLLGKYIPNIQVDTNVGSELSYRLSEDQLYIFEKMLKDLERNGDHLGVLNYGISLTTLEEVFMRVGADHGQEEQQNELEENGKIEHNVNGTNDDLDFNRQYYSETRLDLGYSLLTSCALYQNQFKAMLLKKYYSTLRSWALTLIELCIPVIFMIISVINARIERSKNDLPALIFSLDYYNNPITVVDGAGNYMREYKEYVTHMKHSIQQTENLTEYILKKSDENLPVVRQRYIVGATFFEDHIVAWFNNIPLHSLPLTLNLVHNAILYKEIGKKHKIHVANHPLPYTVDAQLEQAQDAIGSGFQMAFNIGFSMAFVAAFYIIFCVRERTTKAKHLQFVSGVNVFIFWISSYLFDFFHFLITCLFLTATLAAFQEDGFSTFEELGRVYSTLIIFGLSVLPLVYLASLIFHIPTSGFTIMTFFSIFIGCFGFMIVVILKMPQLDLVYISDGMDWFFIFFPQYNLCSAIYHLYILYSSYKICELSVKANGRDDSMVEQICDKNNISYYSWNENGIARNFFFSSLVGIIFFIILIIIEYRVPQKILYSFRPNSVAPPDEDDDDDDVAEEKIKIKNMTQEEINSHSLILRDFSKYYNKFLAVNKLSVGIKGAECFGLLGINGAGKTSTFKMLTGDENISYGDAWVNGLSLKSDMKQVHRIIGYCPQFDALLDNLTGRETMRLFSLLRGVPNNEIKFLCQKLAAEFQFERHIDKKVRQYSGGNKRKLSTAVALIGDPCVVCLDEPSTGMDPAAKRFLWNGLCKVRDSGKCIVLTSHSMEECEALCTRLAIMVNGTFKCLGSTQHLKSKFSEGYTLTVKVKKENISKEITDEEIQPIEDFIKTNFPSAILREKYQELLTYYISQKNIPWSRMFGLMEKGKKSLNIEDYSLGQSSLEQVFLSFAKYQKEEQVRNFE